MESPGACDAPRTLVKNVLSCCTVLKNQLTLRRKYSYKRTFLRSMTIGIINAMHKEHEQLVGLLQRVKEVRDGRCLFVEGELNGCNLVLMESGIGKVNAAVGAVELIRRYHPDAVVNTGVAGGIDPTLDVMDVVVGSKVAYHDVDCGPESELGQVQGLPLYYEADGALFDMARNLRTETNLHGGLICSGDRFITDKEQLERIKERYPDGLAVDMESGAIAQVCYLYETPFLSFRIISDTPGATHHLDQYQNFWETMAERSFEVSRTLLEALTTSRQ